MSFSLDCPARLPRDAPFFIAVASCLYLLANLSGHPSQVCTFSNLRWLATTFGVGSKANLNQLFYVKHIPKIFLFCFFENINTSWVFSPWKKFLLLNKPVPLCSTQKVYLANINLCRLFSNFFKLSLKLIIYKRAFLIFLYVNVLHSTLEKRLDQYVKCLTRAKFAPWKKSSKSYVWNRNDCTTFFIVHIWK